jgi:hypothetical protein
LSHKSTHQNPTSLLSIEVWTRIVNREAPTPSEEQKVPQPSEIEAEINNHVSDLTDPPRTQKRKRPLLKPSIVQNWERGVIGISEHGPRPKKASGLQTRIEAAKANRIKGADMSSSSPSSFSFSFSLHFTSLSEARISVALSIFSTF